FNQSGRWRGRLGREEAAGTGHLGSCEAGAGAGARLNITALVAEKWSTPSCHHAERSKVDLRGRGPTGFLRVCELGLVPCLSPPASGRETERSEAAGQRSSP